MAFPVRRGAPEPSPAGSESPEWILAGRAWVRGRLQPVEIAISRDGWILSLGRDRRGGRRHDVGDAVILPSATDLHVHFREPGPPGAAETIPAGTIQAALGGVGLVGEMPNTAPPVTDRSILEAKAALVRGRAAVDVLLYGSPTVPRSLAGLARAAGAFKLYLSPTTGIPEGPAPSELGPLLARIARLSLPLAVHAEDPRIFAPGHRLERLSDWDASRPLAAERGAVEELLATAPPGLNLHVAHVTSAAIGERLKERGICFETTPHHLLLSRELRGLGTRGKVNPPLRSEAERAALWAMFARGDVPVLASDHAPHSIDAKDAEFARAPSGMPGVETMLPLLLARVRAGDLALEVLLRAAADRPARWAGQPSGRIAPGHRANLLVVDFTARSKVEAARLHAPCGWTAFEGLDAIFPREHYRHGEAIVRDGEYVGRPAGDVVRPEFALGSSRT